jgi:hypothetical protein
VYCIIIAAPYQFPIANAGQDQTVDEKAIVKLDDSNSPEICSIGQKTSTYAYVAFIQV